MRLPILVGVTVCCLTLASGSRAAETLHVYGPGGPLPAMKEAAAVFGKAHGITVDVTAGPTPQWIDRAKADADLIFSGSEVMMSDFIATIPQIDAATVEPLYLRPAAILVRPGNPAHIGGIADLLKPGHRILVVNGAGQQGLWEDVAGTFGRHRHGPRLSEEHRGRGEEQQRGPAGLDIGPHVGCLADLDHLAARQSRPGRPGPGRAEVRPSTVIPA